MHISRTVSWFTIMAPIQKSLTSYVVFFRDIVCPTSYVMFIPIYFTQTLYILLLSQLPMVLNSLPPIPCFLSFCNNLRCGTLTKALAKSKNTMSTHYPSSTYLNIRSKNNKRFVTHDRPFLNPCREFITSLCFSKKTPPSRHEQQPQNTYWSGLSDSPVCN